MDGVDLCERMLSFYSMSVMFSVIHYLFYLFCYVPCVVFGLSCMFIYILCFGFFSYNCVYYDLVYLSYCMYYV